MKCHGNCRTAVKQSLKRIWYHKRRKRQLTGKSNVSTEWHSEWNSRQYTRGDFNIWHKVQSDGSSSHSLGFTHRYGFSGSYQYSWWPTYSRLRDIQSSNTRRSSASSPSEIFLFPMSDVNCVVKCLRRHPVCCLHLWRCLPVQGKITWTQLFVKDKITRSPIFVKVKIRSSNLCPSVCFLPRIQLSLH